MWRERLIDGQTYNFDHLIPFEIVFSRAATDCLSAVSWAITVVFDCHVFTRGMRAGEKLPEAQYVWYDKGGHVRVFSPVRFKLSKGLAELIRGLPDGRTRCFLARRNNYMVFKLLPQEGGLHQTWQVYFTLTRHQGSTPLLLYVQSAYIKDQPRNEDRKDTTTFGTICAETLGLIKKRKR